MKIIIGLGNPGAQYAHTFHNIGFMAAECLAEKLNVSFSKKECDALTAHTDFHGERVILCKPQTFMNLSGIAAQKMVQYYKCGESDLIVLYDDIDLEKGAVRYRESGSGGTHNGMRDIVSKLGEKIKRIRIGIGRPSPDRNLADYVLSVVPLSERALIKAGIIAAADKALELLAD